MYKKILTVMMAFLMIFTITGCDSEKKKPGGSASKEPKGVTIKTVKDFKESEGLVKYFTIEGEKFSIPETVGELANYLKQIGDVTLGSTGEKVEDVTIEAGGISSMVAYLSIETKDGEEGRVWIRYENTTDDTIPVAEASMTYLEIKDDELSEADYEKTFKNITIVTENYTFKMNDKKGFDHVSKNIPGWLQMTDGRFEYEDDLKFRYIFDCCSEQRDGTLRGLLIKYPSINK